MRIEGYASLLRDVRTIAGTLALHDGHKRNAAPPAAPPERPQTVVNRVHPEQLGWVVTAIREETRTTRTLVLAPRDAPVPAFLPGQYLNVFVEIGGIRTSRPQSISSSPTQPGCVELTIKEKPDGFVSHFLVRELAVGDELRTSGPEGDLFFNPARDRDRLLLVAGGSGITPFMGMIEYVLGRYPAVLITLLYASHRADDVIFAQRLAELARQHPDRLKVVLVISGPDASWGGERGYIDRDLIARYVPATDLRLSSVFVCGPRPMQQHVLEELAALGMPRERVQVESSGVADDVTSLPGWPAEIEPTASFGVSLPGQSSPVRALAGEPLMTSLERAGLGGPALCRNGVCGACRRKLLGGSVYSDPAVANRDSDRAEGYVLLCTSYPLGDVVLARS